MADARLRSLERDAMSDPAAETRLLRERPRTGALTEQDLRLANYLGHAPAAEAIGERPYPPGVRDLQARLIGLYDHGLEVALRAQVALARSFLPQFEAERRNSAVRRQTVHADRDSERALAFAGRGE